MRTSRALAALLAAACATAASAATVEKDRRRGAEILREVKGLLERRYYDPSFHGEGLAKRLARAEIEMQEATSERMTFGVVARLVAGLEDSHTFFVPPAPAGAIDYGWTPRMVGDRCFVVDVRPDSDAAALGLRTGDEVLAIEGAPPERTRLWQTLHLARLLRPRPDVSLTVRGADGVVRDLTPAAKVLAGGPSVGFAQYLDTLKQKLRARSSSRFVETGGVLVWKLASFEKRGRSIQEGVARARRYPAVVVDLRGNGGGDSDALRRFTGAFFPDPAPITLGWLRSRRGLRALTAERWSRHQGFTGRLVVVVDSDSASASEVFARTVQLRGRGTVVGDRTAGAVMLSRTHVMVTSRDRRFVPYAVSVTEAAVEMPGGTPLGRSGVVPDEVVLPTPEEMRAGHDPALARAVSLAGGALGAETAGRLFAASDPD
jgi:C-terminal processing protease CtpA/Prc